MMEINMRKEEYRINLLVAKKRFEMEVSRFQPEIELFELKVRVWVATHREERDEDALPKSKREAGG